MRIREWLRTRRLERAERQRLIHEEARRTGGARVDAQEGAIRQQQAMRSNGLGGPFGH